MADEADLERRRAEIRNALRRQFQRTKNDPFKSGAVIDPAVKRWVFTRYQGADQVKIRPTKITRPSFISIVIMISLPIGLIYLIKKDRELRFEHPERYPLPARVKYFNW